MQKYMNIIEIMREVLVAPGEAFIMQPGEFVLALPSNIWKFLMSCLDALMVETA
jgi:hypothetical protein